MITYARIVDGIVAEMFTPPEDAAITDCFREDIAATFVAVPSGVTPASGWSYDGKSFAAPLPVTVTPTIPAVTGNQWALAISDLGLASAWMAGVAASKASDQVRVGLIARDTTLSATDPLLIRVTGKCAGVALATVFAHAQTMPTV